jgi:hypothetical protein
MLSIQDGPDRPNSCGAQVEAIQEHARQMGRIADALEGFSDAAGTVHGFGERLDALCAWLKSRWPWAVMVSLFVLERAVNLRPEDVQHLADAASALAKLAGGVH